MYYTIKSCLINELITGLASPEPNSTITVELSHLFRTKLSKQWGKIRFFWAIEYIL